MFDMEDTDSGLEEELRAALGDTAFKTQVNTDGITTLRRQQRTDSALC